MKLNKITLLCLSAFAALSPLSIASTSVEITGDEAYSIGFNYANSLIGQVRSQEEKANVRFDRNMILKGFGDALVGSSGHLSQAQRLTILTNLDELIKERVVNERDSIYERNSRVGQDVVNFAISKGAERLQNGVVMKTLVEPNSNDKPSSTDIVTLHYTLTALDGTVLDTTAQREPQSFVVSGLMPGVLEAVMQSSEGGQYSLIIPSDVGFGKLSSSLPPGTYLKFDYEVVFIRNPFPDSLLTPELKLK